MGAGLHAAVLPRHQAWPAAPARRDAGNTTDEEERCRLALLGADDGVWDWSLLGTFYVCPRWKAQLGLPDDDRPARATDWLDRVHPADQASLRQALSDHLSGRTDRLRHEHRLRHADGTWRSMLCRGRAIRGVDGFATRIAGTMVDITDQAAARARLRHAALHDSLTGLANRSLLLALLARVIETRQPGRRYAILFVDVNGFKQVNDTHGHLMGDAILIAIARRLESSLRAFDTACRYGGDEFALVLSAIDTPRPGGRDRSATAGHPRRAVHDRRPRTAGLGEHRRCRRRRRCEQAGSAHRSGRCRDVPRQGGRRKPSGHRRRRGGVNPASVDGRGTRPRPRPGVEQTRARRTPWQSCRRPSQWGARRPPGATREVPHGGTARQAGIARGLGAAGRREHAVGRRRGAAMTARWWRPGIAGALVAGLVVLAPRTPFHAQGQAPATPTTPGEQPTFRTGVRLATVDAVVTDGKGRHVTDLTPADFEVVERGRRQTVRQVIYVRTGPGAPLAPTAGGLVAGGTPTTPAPPATAPEAGRSNLPSREQTSRVLAVVVDDLSMWQFRSVVDARTMLKKFIERDVAAGDLVAILRTSGGAGTLQQFTTDRRLLAAAIERVQWVGRLAGFEAALASDVAMRRMPIVDDVGLDVESAADLLAEGSIGALHYALRGLESLPGRKTLVFVSEGSGLGIGNPRSEIPAALKRVIDRANRAGVVLYAIDPGGIRSATLAVNGDRGSNVAQRRTPNYTNEPLQPGPVDGGRAMAQTPEAALAESKSRWVQFDRQEWLRWLAEQTGGFAIVNQNDIDAGIGRIVDDTRGYYLVGFDTSLAPGVRPDPDDVTIKALRPGLQIRARRGRFGPANPDDGPLPRSGDPLVAAAMSPFSAGSLDVQVTALFGHDAEGAHVRAVVDVDPRGLMLADAGERREGAVTLQTMLFNNDGDIVSQSREAIPVRLDGVAYDRARTLGLRYSVRLPVPRPGGYQVRAAVRDDRSDRVGTGARFVEVPKVGKDRVALSGVILTEAAAADRPMAVTFAPGSVIEYTCTVYDGRSDRTAGFSTTATVLRDGRPVYTSPPVPIAGAAAGADTVAPVPFRGRLTLARDQQPGAYTLLVSVEPAIADGERRSRPSTQWVDFEVR